MTASFDNSDWVARQRRIFRRNLLIVLVLCFWVLLIYKDVYQARFFLDDYLHLHLIERIGSLRTPFAEDIMLGAFYRPGVFPFWKLNYVLAGLNPAAYYAANLLTLMATALVLMQVMQHLTGNKGVSGFATLLFAVSPITAIGVLWLSNRFDLYSTFFFLVSLLLFLRYLRFRRKSDISWSLLLGSYSYFCKEIAITLPAVLFLSGAFMFQYRGELTRGILRRIAVLTLPYLVVAGAFMVWRYAVLGSMGGYSGEERVKITAGYIAKLIGCFGDYVWLFSSPLIFLVVAILLVALFAKKEMVRRNPIAMYGLAFAAVTSAPLAMVLKVEKVMTYQTPRFFYLPGIGLVIFLAATYDPRSGPVRRRFAVVFLAVMALLSSLNSFLVAFHTKEMTQRAEKSMHEIGEYLSSELPKDEPSIVFACERGLDVAIDSSIKVYYPDLFERAFVVNCAAQTQVIASEALHKARGADLLFPQTFAKNPMTLGGMVYGVVLTTPKEILDDLAQKANVFALYKDRRGRLTRVSKDDLRAQMETMGATFE